MANYALVSEESDGHGDDVVESLRSRVPRRQVSTEVEKVASPARGPENIPDHVRMLPSLAQTLRFAHSRQPAGFAIRHYHSKYVVMLSGVH
jgi:hypothetical protein